MFCNKCGATLDEGTVFCSNCGKKVLVSDDSTTPILEETNVVMNLPDPGAWVNKTVRASGASGLTIAASISFIASFILLLIGLDSLKEGTIYYATEALSYFIFSVGCELAGLLLIIIYYLKKTSQD